MERAHAAYMEVDLPEQPGICPVEDVCEFKKTMETMLSEGCCHVLSIRPAGGLIL